MAARWGPQETDADRKAMMARCQRSEMCLPHMLNDSVISVDIKSTRSTRMCRMDEFHLYISIILVKNQCSEFASNLKVTQRAGKIPAWCFPDGMPVTKNGILLSKQPL